MAVERSFYFPEPPPLPAPAKGESVGTSAAGSGQVIPGKPAADVASYAESGSVYGPGSYSANHDAAATAREYVRTMKEGERNDAHDALLAETVLRNAVGAEYEPGSRVLQQYLASLPAGERERVTREAQNDPQKIFALGLKALGPMPTDPAKIAEEIATHEKRMGTDRRGWNADEKAQMRYRSLLRARDHAK